jgi:sugar O-acyltransferase (sialic acid O-acetyltransferase NeuD family)
VLVIGGSDQGRQVIDVLEAAGDLVVAGVVDRALPIGSKVVGHVVVGSDLDLATCASTTDADGFVVAIGDNHVRATTFAHARDACPALEPVSAIHPHTVIARDATVGPGSILMAGAVVSNGCTVGTGALLGTNSSVDHDGRLENFASLAPGAATGGNVRIGTCTAVGLGASIVHAVTIGEHTVIGAGAVVIDDVPGLVVAYGMPARVARSRSAGEPYL